MSLFIYILNKTNQAPDDLEIIREPGRNKPGQARLRAATVGEVDPAAPNSLPLLSSRGGKIGFVAREELLEPDDFESAYLIK